MDRLVYTYALIKSLSDKGGDYLDCFWPFTIKVLNQTKFAHISSIQKKLIDDFDLEIPIHVLKSVLNRAKKIGYIQKDEEDKKDKYKLTENGVNYLDKLETIKEVNRRINSLLDDISMFFKENDIDINREDVNKLLTFFIQNNIEPFCRHISPKIQNNSNTSLEINEAQEELLIDYIKIAEEKKPEDYKTLKDMVLGSIISVVLFFEDSSEIVEIKKRKFKNFKVFFDTNYIFSLLELTASAEGNLASNELFNLLKKNEFILKVFDFTVDEIVIVITRFIKNCDTYPKTVGIDTIESSLKQKGWTKTDAREFITNIENILSERSIEIERTDINLEKFEPDIKELIESIQIYKPYQNDFTRNHDLAAIMKIIEIRGRAYRKIEKSKAIFLTSDIRLSRFNRLEMNHNTKSTICETILDRLLTNILWLKDPNINLSLKAIVAAHSQDMLVKKRVWDSFYKILRQLKQEGKVEEENISALFYHDYIEENLRVFDESEADSIDSEFVMDKLEEAAKEQEIKEEKKIKKLEQEFVEKLEKKTSDFEEKKNREWENKVEKIRSGIRSEAGTIAKKYIRRIKIAIVIIMVIPLVTSIITMNLIAFGIIITAITALSLITGIVGPIDKLWKELEQKWFSRIYTKRIKEANLDNLK